MVRRIVPAALVAMILLGAFAARSQANLVTPIIDNKEREARQAKLAQMAVLVSGLSINRSKLMLKSSISANPDGRPLRPGDEYGNSFLTVYPASTPVSARLLVTTPDGSVLRQYGRILGAMEVITSVGDKGKAEPGAYLLFVPINGPITPELPVWLVSLKADDDGRVTYAAAASSTVKITPSKLGDAPSPSVTASIDFTKAAVSMTWKEQTYSFSFDMEICYV